MKPARQVSFTPDVLLTPTGEVRKVTPANGESYTEEELKQYVGGYLDLIGHKGEDRCLLVVNYDQKNRKLPKNEQAIKLCGFSRVIIRGPALYIRAKNFIKGTWGEQRRKEAGLLDV